MEYALSRTVCILMLSFKVTAQANSICQPKNISYHVGEQAPLLNISAEEVSDLDQSCLKEVRIPGALETRLIVEKAEFGYNPNYIVGTSGIHFELLFDEINVFKTSCDGIREQQGFAITTNASEVFNGRKLCLQIIPETRNRPLGGYVKGGIIVVYAIVTVAECQKNDDKCNPSSCERKCQETADGFTCICSKPTLFPPVKTTQSVTENGNSPAWTSKVTKAATTTVTMQTPQVTAKSTTRSTTVSSRPLPTSPKVATATAPVNHQTITIPRTTTAVAYVTPKTTEETTITSNRTFESTASIKTSSSTSTYSTSSPEYYRFSTVISFTTASTVTDVTTHNHTDEAAPLNHNSGQEMFGLLEGLYLVGAGIVVLLALTLTVCIVRRRQQRCFHLPLSGTISGSSDGVALAWRENWLVRYNDNNSETVADSENDFRLIHGKFHHCSNPELHHIHLDTYTGGDEVDEENAYDNPWPLIRLDSDFMEKTKRLEREMSSTCLSDDSPRIEHENETMHADEPVQTDNTSRNNIKADISKITEGEDKSTPGAKYSMIRVQRSSSKSSRYSTMPHHKTLTQSNSQTSGHETMTVDRNTRRTRRRTSHSFSSQCSADIEDFVKKEMGNIEAVFDKENITGTIDIESRNSVEETNKQKGWKVSAIYAIVSNTTNDGKKNQNTRSSTRRSASKRSNGSPVRDCPTTRSRTRKRMKCLENCNIMRLKTKPTILP